MKLEKKIIIHISILILVVTVILQFIFYRNIYKLINTNNKKVLNIYSKALALDHVVGENLFVKNKVMLNKHLSSIWPELTELNSVIITDTQGRIYFYRNKKKLFDSSMNYEEKVRETIENIPSISNVGVSSDSLEDFKLIKYNGELVGMVGVKKYYEKNVKLKSLFIEEIIIGTLLVIAMTITLGLYLAKTIKAQIFGYEPSELADIHNERQLIFNSLNDRILTLNKEGKLKYISERTGNKMEEKDLDILKSLYDEVILKKEKHILNRQIIFSNERAFVNCIKISQNKDKKEVLFIIKREEPIKKIAKEITGVTQIIESMRANVHEFKNKIHVISGLVKLEEYKELEKYVSNIRVELNEENNDVQNIEDSVIKALLLTKISLAKEKGISLNLDKGSNLMGNHKKVYSEDLIVIIGNLIENSIESFNSKIEVEKNINVKIIETEMKIFISVSDNGEKIKNSKDIFKMGYSSKGENRGSGLYLIKNLVSMYKGKINIVEKIKSKTFYIELFKGDE